MNMVVRAMLASTALCVAVMTATPASAALTLGSANCALGDIGPPAATACRGWYEGNLNNNSPADRADQAAALNSLLGVATYTQANISWLETGNFSGNTVNFATALYGQTVVSFHVGAANGQTGNVGYSGTAFFVFDAGNLVGGLDSIAFNRAGLSNARLYSTGTPAVPEPATWMMLIGGFGFVGGMLRRRKGITALA